jgi:predicted dehydrogenase
MKIAVIGCGYWGPNLIRNLVQSNKVRDVVCCDLSEPRLQRMKTLYPAVKTMTDYHELLKENDLDGVVIATPVGHHFPIARDFLAQGKHVMIEKPMTHSFDSGLELVQLAEEKERILMVGHTFEYTGAVHKIKEIIQSGELGKVLYVSSIRVNLGLFQQDINVVWDLAPHDISILLYVLGETPVSVSSQGMAHYKPGIEDVAITTLNFKDGLIAFFHNSWLDPKKIRKFTIVGTRKMLVYDDIKAQEKIKIYDKGLEVPPYYDTFAEFHFAYRSGDIRSPKVDEYEPLKLEIDCFLESIKTGRTPPTDGYSGLRVVSVLEAASKSLKNGGRAVPVPGLKILNKNKTMANRGNGVNRGNGGGRPCVHESAQPVSP